MKTLYLLEIFETLNKIMIFFLTTFWIIIYFYLYNSNGVRVIESEILNKMYETGAIKC